MSVVKLAISIQGAKLYFELNIPDGRYCAVLPIGVVLIKV